jgi:hypothetical protein
LVLLVELRLLNRHLGALWMSHPMMTYISEANDISIRPAVHFHLVPIFGIVASGPATPQINLPLEMIVQVHWQCLLESECRYLLACYGTPGLGLI